MRVLSWNVNGLRAVIGKGFCDWIGRAGADIVGIQEVRAHEEQLAPCLERLGGTWHCAFRAAERPGYSGVGLLSRMKPDRVATTMADHAFDIEGRVQLARFGKLTVVNAYFPNGSGKDRDNGRIPFKLAFYRRLFDMLESKKRRAQPVLVIGDFNTAHREIDLARPKANVRTSGFTPPNARNSIGGSARAGSTPSASSSPAPGTTRGGASASGCAKRTSAGASTTCSPPPAPQST
jgi:exodeoxyribonuclease-3